MHKLGDFFFENLFDSFVIAPAGTHDSKLLFPNLRNFRILRNSKVLKPEILSLDKAYANNAI
ncbi:hypothetical protein KQC08_01610, partial [Leptospira sp. Pond_2020]|nr:hypothetical protein [Leptospira sp. Pond_2020]